MLGEVGDDENENEDYSGREGDGAEIVCRGELCFSACWVGI